MQSEWLHYITDFVFCKCFYMVIYSLSSVQTQRVYSSRCCQSTAPIVHHHLPCWLQLIGTAVQQHLEDHTCPLWISSSTQLSQGILLPEVVFKISADRYQRGWGANIASVYCVWSSRIVLGAQDRLCDITPLCLLSEGYSGGVRRYRLGTITMDSEELLTKIVISLTFWSGQIWNRFIQFNILFCSFVLPIFKPSLDILWPANSQQPPSIKYVRSELNVIRHD